MAPPSARRALPYVVIGLLLAAIVGILWWAIWREPAPVPPDVLPPRVDTALVAERARAAVLDSLQAVERVRDDALRREAAARAARTAALSRAAAAAEIRADAMAETARALGDTLSAAWAAYEAADARGDSLAVALSVADSARLAEAERAARWRVLYDSADASRARLAALSTELREAVGRAAQRDRCRLLGPIPCPSRTTVAVLAAAGGALGGHYLTRPRE